uniref:Uncharacterized protein n=1 Tax=Rhizophora mucronata TaxID=61149 RepID=A0A2P2PTS1_RHIMU
MHTCIPANGSLFLISFFYWHVTLHSFDKSGGFLQCTCCSLLCYLPF